MGSAMKAAVYERYGGPEVVELRVIPRPDPGPGHVLVRVRAASVTTGDWRQRAAAYPGILWLPGRIFSGLFRPRHPVLGSEFAGEVAATGEGVTGFAEGDRVYGMSLRGAHAEYLVIPADNAIAPIPEGLTFQEAAALPFGGLCALVFLRDFAALAPGARLLVVGASGGVGTYAVQVGKALGAEVTGVASTPHLDYVRELGADHVIDYTKETVAQAGAGYDVILDTVGAVDFMEIWPAMTAQGLFLPLNFGLREMIQSLWFRRASGQRVILGVNGDKKDDLDQLSAMVAEGQVRPKIDSTFAFEDIQAAYAHVEGRHRKGSVVLAMSEV